MKVAVIGTGKTGSYVEKLSHQVIGPFNSKNLVNVQELKKADVGVVFTTGEVFLEIFPILLEAKIPMAVGSTGFEWTDDMERQVMRTGTTWIHANNFSLGMNLVKAALTQFNRLMPLLSNPQIKLKEIHHTHKKDKPSGTAKYWAKWLDYDGEITSIREADVMGIHEAVIETELEKISITHEAHDRALFAKGALWAANYLIDTELPSGVFDFQELIEQKFLGDRK